MIASDNGSECDDGQFCTINDACLEGVCVGGAANDCGMTAETCQVITCDEAGKICTQAAEPDGAACVSDNLCEVGASCTAGVCVGTINECFFAPVPDECHVALCNPSTGMCEPFVGNDGGSCTDPATPCTSNKYCDGGTCVGGQPKDCSSASSDCAVGVCDPNTGMCLPQALAVGSSCPSATDSCNNGECDANGVCQPVPLPGTLCPEASDDCNQGICDATGLCAPTPINEAGMCDDGSSCTSGSTCTAGVCGGGTSNVTIYFTEDFASNVAGWTLGPEWSIGPAMSSTSTTCGNGDPGNDHSASSDNGVAGVVIGGNATTSQHPMQYLTSPVIDTSMVVGPMELGYYRWLNSDYTPYMKNQVEVFDGTNWVVVWETLGSPGVKDSAWTFMSHDIAAYKNANMQIRFGFNIASGGVFTCSQWNVDDILIASGACP